MASSLNLLVLRLAQFHSESGTGGISSLLGRNEEELIAEAIAHHRASIHIQQLNRIGATNNNTINLPEKPTAMYSPIRTYSSYSSSSSSSSTSNFKSRNCCSKLLFFQTHKRKRRYWHLRRSPQNIKHLLDFNYLLENQKLTLLQRPTDSPTHHPLANHLASIHVHHQQRISIWYTLVNKKKGREREREREREKTVTADVLMVSIKQSDGLQIRSLMSQCVSEDGCAFLFLFFLYIRVSLFDCWHMLLIDSLVKKNRFSDMSKLIFNGLMPFLLFFCISSKCCGKFHFRRYSLFSHHHHQQQQRRRRRKIHMHTLAFFLETLNRLV